MPNVIKPGYWTKTRRVYKGALDVDKLISDAIISGVDLTPYALKSNVLELDNTTTFTPSADYHPATKKYVDDNSGIANDGSINFYGNTFRLNTSPSAVPGQTGEFSWNADEETYNFVLDGAVLQGGQELHWHVRNQSGADINDGDPIMAVGTLGSSGRILVDLMDGTDVNNAKYFLGLATEDIPNNTNGKIAHFGKTRGLDTTGTPYGEVWNEGEVIWVSPTTIGGLTNIQPTSGTRLPIAFVVTKHANQGNLAVRVTDGTYMSEAHDLDLTDRVNKGTIYYDSASGVYKFKLVSEIIVANITGTYEIDWTKEAAVYVLTMTGDTTISDTGFVSGIGNTIEIYLNGNFVPTWPAHWEETPSSDAYSGAVTNHYVSSIKNATGGSEAVLFSNENLST